MGKVKWHNVFMVLILFFLITAIIIRLSLPKQAVEQEYTIGVILPLSGNSENLGKTMNNAIDLAIDETENIKITTIVRDTGCDSAKAIAVVRELLKDKNLIAVIGEMCSTATLSVAPLLEENKIILISPASSHPAISQAGEYVFRTFPSDINQAVEAAKFALSNNATSAAVLAMNNDYGKSLADTFVQEFDGTIKNIQYFIPDSSDLRNEVKDIPEIDVLFVVAYPTDGARIVQHLNRINKKPLIITSETLFDDTFIDLAEAASEGVYIVVPMQNEDEHYLSFAKKYQDRFKQEPRIYAAESYDAYNIITLALRSTDRTKTEMQSFLSRIQDYEGASGKISFDANGDVIKPFEILTVNNGKFLYYRSW